LPGIGALTRPTQKRPLRSVSAPIAPTRSAPSGTPATVASGASVPPAPAHPVPALSPLRTRPRLSLARHVAGPYPRQLRQTARTRPAFSAQSSSLRSSWR